MSQTPVNTVPKWWVIMGVIIIGARIARTLLHHIVKILRLVCLAVGTCEADVEKTDVNFKTTLQDDR